MSEELLYDLMQKVERIAAKLAELKADTEATSWHAERNQSRLTEVQRKAAELHKKFNEADTTH
jgi:hypothetical protein